MADLDIITLAEGQSVVRTDAAANAPRLQAMITGLSLWCDKLCGPFVTRQVVEVASGPYSGPILLSKTPVLSITSVVEHVGLVNTTITSTDYELSAEGHYVRLFRLASGYDTTWTAGSRNFTVTMQGGRYATTEAVAYDVKERFMSLLAEKWQWEAPMWQRTRGEFRTDDEGNPSGYPTEARIRELFQSELLPPGIA